MCIVTQPHNNMPFFYNTDLWNIMMSNQNVCKWTTIVSILLNSNFFLSFICLFNIKTVYLQYLSNHVVERETGAAFFKLAPCFLYTPHTLSVNVFFDCDKL